MQQKQIGWKFDNTYAKLPASFLTKINPLPVKNPETVIFNNDLTKEIGLNFSKIDNKEIAQIFSGNKLPQGSEAISQAYAGHQFGHFTILGDGRAHLIGEHITQNNKRIDIQFKGSGRTPYSRSADGRAGLGPMLREYLISEAMNSLGVPTTRSLAVIKTGEEIIRDEILEGAILTRIASSHIRVGTFQYALIQNGGDNLRSLLDYTINRHYSSLKEKKNPALELLKAVLNNQVDLICNWMRVGFVHGVMNTDNMTVSGETIDYGPCAFIDNYDPGSVFSSIDVHGRYAYFNQPRVAKWNLERFAESLLSVIDEDNEKAIKLATEVLKTFPEIYKYKWLEMMRKKLGLSGKDNDDEQLIVELLTWMHKYKADYTNTFCYLMNRLSIDDKIYDNEEFLEWKKRWKNRLKLNNNNEQSIKKMLEANPLIIPRNYLVEDCLKQATKNNDLFKFNELLKLLKNSDNSSLISKYQSVPNNEEKYITYCGT